MYMWHSCGMFSLSLAESGQTGFDESVGPAR